MPLTRRPQIKIANTTYMIEPWIMVLALSSGLIILGMPWIMPGIWTTSLINAGPWLLIPGLLWQLAMTPLYGPKPTIKDQTNSLSIKSFRNYQYTLLQYLATSLMITVGLVYLPQIAAAYSMMLHCTVLISISANVVLGCQLLNTVMIQVICPAMFNQIEPEKQFWDDTDYKQRLLGVGVMDHSILDQSTLNNNTIGLLYTYEKNDEDEISITHAKPISKIAEKSATLQAQAIIEIISNKKPTLKKRSDNLDALKQELTTMIQQYTKQDTDLATTIFDKLQKERWNVPKNLINDVLHPPPTVLFFNGNGHIHPDIAEQLPSFFPEGGNTIHLITFPWPLLANNNGFPLSRAGICLAAIDCYQRIPNKEKISHLRGFSLGGIPSIYLAYHLQQSQKATPWHETLCNSMIAVAGLATVIAMILHLTHPLLIAHLSGHLIPETLSTLFTSITLSIGLSATTYGLTECFGACNQPAEPLTTPDPPKLIIDRSMSSIFNIIATHLLYTAPCCLANLFTKDSLNNLGQIITHFYKTPKQPPDPELITNFAAKTMAWPGYPCFLLASAITLPIALISLPCIKLYLILSHWNFRNDYYARDCNACYYDEQNDHVIPPSAGTFKGYYTPVGANHIQGNIENIRAHALLPQDMALKTMCQWGQTAK